MNKSFIFGILLWAFSLLHGELVTAQTVFTRYNQAGYESCRPFKRVVVTSNTSIAGRAWDIKNSGGTSVLTGNLGTSLTTAQNDWTSKSYSYAVDFSSLNTVGNYTFVMAGATTVTLKINDNPYEYFLDRAIRYFKVHRSGTSDCLDHSISHTGDASCKVFHRAGTNNDDANWSHAAVANIDMQGGWYDAGDYLKFTETIAYSCYNLLRAYEINPAIFQKKNYSITSYVDIVDEAHFGLEYLVKTMPAGRTNEFVIQVGSDADHNEGDRLPENDALNGNRPCYSALSRTQMGLTVAALALGATTFNALGNTTDGTRYQNQALLIFTRAEAAPVANAWWEGGGEVFYADASYNENMALAAYELWKLTGTAAYLTKAIAYANAQGAGGWASWGDTEMFNNWRLYSQNATCATNLRADLTSFKANAARAGNIWRLPHDFTWGTLYSEIEVANAAALYYLQNNTADNQYNNMYWDVMDYTFGQNNWGMAMMCEPAANLPFAITTSYSQYYKLQPAKWPIGEIVQGPCDKETHDDLAFGYSPTWEDQFNPTASTTSGVFFHRNTDYATIETAIDGISDAILMFALAQKMTPTCAPPLPVEFLELTLEEKNETVHIEWSTASETNNKTFEVERSLDGEQFVTIGSKAGALTSTAFHRYEYNDQQAKKGLAYYYRIKQVDVDGQYTYSKIQTITLSASKTIYAFPNPFQESITVQFSSEDIGALVVVSDLLGHELAHYTVNPTATLQVGLELPKGIYFMTVQSSKQSQVLKLIKE